jgi:adenine-specific DNA methylase
VSQAFVKTKPSFLEAGLPCASLSAECQRDNNARQRPPQNRLHIWWARRPPTICRAAILAALLPHDLQFDESVLPSTVDEPTAADLENLPRKLERHRDFFERLLREVGPTPLTQEHETFLRAMGITGDAAAAYRRMAIRDEQSRGGPKIPLPDALVYRHLPAFAVSPSSGVICELLRINNEMMQIGDGPIVVLDSMAGGG